MRYSFLPAAAFSLIASAAMAGDIMSCSFEMPMPPPHRMGMMGPADMPPPHDNAGPAASPGAKVMTPPPETAPHPGDHDAKDIPPSPPHMPAPSVEAKLNCTHGIDKSEKSLTELTEKGWKLQTAVPLRGSITFYLTK